MWSHEGQTENSEERAAIIAQAIPTTTAMKRAHSRRQNAFVRWWSGPKGAYLMDYTDCSLLIARNAVSDEAIEALLPQQ